MAEAMQAVRKPVLAGHGGGVGIQLVPADPASRISLRAGAADVEALSTALSLNLPTKPKGAVSGNGRMAFWLGPDEWLVIDETGADLMAAAAASGAVHSAVDVSNRNTAMVISGPAVEEVLNAGCPQDLSLKAFPVGAVSRTIFSKVEIVLYRIDEHSFRIECWRSFATFVFGLLSEAAQEAEG